jgi:uncharacterized protein
MSQTIISRYCGALRPRGTAAMAAVFLCAAAGVLHAQPAAPKAEAIAPAANAPAVSPTAESLALAHTMIEKSNAGGLSAMNGLTPPIASVMHQMGIHPDQSRVVMTEAIMPTLVNHTDEMTDIAAQSYAKVLSTDELKAIIAFYETDAGKALVRAHFRVAQLNMDGFNALFEKIMPEIEAKTQEVFKAHGWTKS